MKSYQNIYFQFCIYFYILPTSMSLNCSAIKHKSLEKTHQLGAWQMLCLKDYFFVILDNDVLDRIFSLLKYIEQKIFSFINEHERELVHSIITCNQHPLQKKMYNNAYNDTCKKTHTNTRTHTQTHTPIHVRTVTSII